MPRGTLSRALCVRPRIFNHPAGNGSLARTCRRPTGTAVSPCGCGGHVASAGVGAGATVRRAAMGDMHVTHGQDNVNGADKSSTCIHGGNSHRSWARSGRMGRAVSPVATRWTQTVTFWAPVRTSCRTTLVGDAPILCVDRPQRCAARGVRNARQAPHKAVRSFGSSRRSSFCRMPLAHGARWTENRPPPVDRGSLGRIRRVFERKPSPGSSPLHHRPRTRPLGEGSEEHVLLSNRESV